MFTRRSKVKRIIKKYRQELEKLGIRPKQIILYGSYARGRPEKYSDIDLIVISDDFKKLNFRERLELLGIAAGKVFEPIEALGYTPDELTLQEKGSFLEQVILNGLAFKF